MKILSNFDTKLADKLLKEFQDELGEDRVLLIHKSKLYFYKYLGLPFGLYFVLLIVGSYMIYTYDTVVLEAELAFWLFFLVYLFALMARTSGKWINYRMDFLIITPNEVMKYDQSGIFGKEVEKIHANKIKSISFVKKGILNSFLNIGEITVLVEGDSEEGDIVMDYIDSVESVDKDIRRVLAL